MRTLSILVFLTGFFLISGCAVHHFTSPLRDAESWYLKASQTQFYPEYQRLLYHESCKSYARAYHMDFNLFDMTKIRDAIYACSAARNFDQADSFRGFLKRYRDRFPGEMKWSQPRWIVQDPGVTVAVTKRRVQEEAFREQLERIPSLQKQPQAPALQKSSFGGGLS